MQAQILRAYVSVLVQLRTEDTFKGLTKAARL